MTTPRPRHLPLLLLAAAAIPRAALGWSTLGGGRGGGGAPPPSSVADRRDFFRTVATSAAATVLVGAGAGPAVAAPPPTASELRRIQLGHSRVSYLLSNWEELTSTCGTKIMSDLERRQVIRTEGGGGGSCDKTPLRVQEFLGYKSTTDPLFKADKLMVRAANLVDPDDLEGYLDAVERYREKADQGAMMAFTSSWGEANPNGGKEVIDDYLERTKVEVEETEKLLRTVMKYLSLEVLPPGKAIA